MYVRRRMIEIFFLKFLLALDKQYQNENNRDNQMKEHIKSQEMMLVDREITRNPLQTMANYDRINGIVRIYMYIRRGSRFKLFFLLYG